MQWHDEIIGWMATLLLLSGFFTVMLRRFQNVLTCYQLQSLALAIATAVMGAKLDETHLYTVAGISFLLKVVIIPIWVWSFLEKLPAKMESKTVFGPAGSLFAAGGLLLFSHIASETALPPGSDKIDDLTITLTLLLVPLILLVTRRLAVTQMMGILFMENAVTAAGILLTDGMPIVIELGIFLDILIGILVMGILVFRIQSAFDTIDTEEMKTLQG